MKPVEGNDKFSRKEGATTPKNEVKAQVVAFQATTPSLFSKWVFLHTDLTAFTY